MIPIAYQDSVAVLVVPPLLNVLAVIAYGTWLHHRQSKNPSFDDNGLGAVLTIMVASVLQAVIVVWLVGDASSGMRVILSFVYAMSTVIAGPAVGAFAWLCIKAYAAARWAASRMCSARRLCA